MRSVDLVEKIKTGMSIRDAAKEVAAYFKEVLRTRSTMPNEVRKAAAALREVQNLWMAVGNRMAKRQLGGFDEWAFLQEAHQADVGFDIQVLTADWEFFRFDPSAQRKRK